MKQNRYDELLRLLVENGELGLTKEDLQKKLNVDYEDIIERVQVIHKYNNNFISPSGDYKRYGIRKENIFKVKQFLESGSFAEIDKFNSLEKEAKILGVQLTKDQIRNIKNTRLLAIIGCTTGVVTLIWKIIETIFKQ